MRRPDEGGRAIVRRPRSARGWALLIVAGIAVVGSLLFLVLGGVAVDNARIAGFVVAAILGFVLGNLYDTRIALIAVRMMRGPWRALLVFALWWAVLIVAAAVTAEVVVPAASQVAPGLTFLAVCAVIALLMAVSMPFFPATNMNTGSRHGPDPFEQLGVHGALYYVLKAAGFLTVFFLHLGIGMLLGIAAFDPDGFEL